MAFKKAERSQTKLRLAITGPAGSGKTLSALKIARGLVGAQGKIAVIDTENGSASYYSKEYDFDIQQLFPPYLVKKYLDALSEATEYDCVIIDSLSHAWAGEGGILQRKEQLDQRPGSNSFTNWGKMTPEQNALVNAVLLSKVNIICTMRSKTEYVLTDNDKGKKAPQKVGLAPVQREGFDYEFDVVLDVDLETHRALASKDRTNMFSGASSFLITEGHGRAIAQWQDSAKAPEVAPTETPKMVSVPTSTIGGLASVPPFTVKNSTTNSTNAGGPTKTSNISTASPMTVAPTAGDDFISDSQRKRLWAIATNHLWLADDLKAFLSMEFNINSSKEIPKNKYDDICNYLEKYSPKQKEM